MPYDSAFKNRYSFDESRNLSCARDYRAFQHPSAALRLSFYSPPAPTHPRGSVSLDSQSPAAPYESSSLATASGPPDRLRDESVSLDFRSPSAPYKSSSLTFPSKEGGL